MTFFSTVFAEQAVNIVAPDSFNSITGFTVGGILTWAITIVLVVAGIIFFFMLVLGGLRWILSGGDKGSTEQARSQITAALIGLVIIFSAWAILNLIDVVFGVNLLELSIPGIAQG